MIVNSKRLLPALAAAAIALSAMPALSATTQDAAGAPDAHPKVDSPVLFGSIDTMPANLVSNIIGHEVYTEDEKDLGTVSDIVLDDSNRMIALKVGVGGFLGVDETYLAVPIGDVRFSYVDGHLRIGTDLVEQDIRDATGH
ncbi:PRC-barrel domain-containing protein [Oricola nitratireducens]|jgi:sporulation protein YlmC with PRC-barrel domain|uniref:PRC-barrel domain-containing protein n=1 Tax=Oricola nitratireducens TaxID=2775868 RepID=UPI001869402B|nr:PRC-barrel domain-containing protein [Oricola nitratireducens]